MKTARRSVVGTGPGLDANPSFPASALWSLISASNEDKLANHVAKSAERKPGIYPAELAKGAIWRASLRKTLMTSCVQRP